MYLMRRIVEYRPPPIAVALTNLKDVRAEADSSLSGSCGNALKYNDSILLKTWHLGVPRWLPRLQLSWPAESPWR